MSAPFFVSGCTVSNAENLVSKRIFDGKHDTCALAFWYSVVDTTKYPSSTHARKIVVEDMEDIRDIIIVEVAAAVGYLWTEIKCRESFEISLCEGFVKLGPFGFVLLVMLYQRQGLFSWLDLRLTIYELKRDVLPAFIELLDVFHCKLGKGEFEGGQWRRIR